MVSSPKRDKGKKRAHQPSPEAEGSLDNGTIHELIALVDDFHRDMDESFVMDRSSSLKQLKILNDFTKVESK